MRVLSALVLSLTLAGAAQAAEPRAVVEKIADQIAARYFDPAKGERLAAELKAEAAKGAYDRYAAPLDLAQALTARLKPQDSHFNVTWSAEPPAPSAGAQAGQRPPPQGPQESDRRQNYGFRSVEVLPGNVAVINMGYFAHFQSADGPAKNAADAAMTLASGADAVIFDLRDNGGGSPAMVGYLVGHFVPEGANIYNTFKSRGPDRYETPPEPPKTGRRPDMPIYVLVSGRTASAAESFSYTLQAAKRATIVGEPTAGGANPGGFAPVGDGFAVFVSGGSPVNPITGRNWEGAGVIPDVVARPGEALVKAQQLALGKVLEGQGSALAKAEAKWALEALSPPAAVPPTTLADYAGGYGVRAVKVDGGRLVVSHDRRPPLALKPLGKDTFAVEGANVPMRVTFDRDAGGRITGMVQSTSDGRATRFARTS
jgi:hypothetical protein